MSLDLLVFDKSKAPSEPMEFLRWFHKKAEWKADRDYSDIKGTDQPLVDFFMEMIKTYPAMNGPYAPSDEEFEQDPELEDSPYLTDYCIDEDLIYMAFAYSVADGDFVQKLAFKYGLGFFDMFFMYLDEDTKIPVPQLSPAETLKEPGQQEAKEPKKGFFARLFGKK